MILGGVLAAAMCAATGCSVATRLERQRAAAQLSQLTRAERQAQQQDYRPQVVRLQRDSNTFFLAPVDTLPDGERVMSLQIEQVTVVAKVRSVPERNGRVHLDFVVTLPKQLLGSSRSVVITPLLHKPDGTVTLEDLVIRGGRFSLLQERDYWQYETYVRRFRPDTQGREAAFQRFVKFPYRRMRGSIRWSRAAARSLTTIRRRFRRTRPRRRCSSRVTGECRPWMTAPTGCRLGYAGL
ncbi:conserved hypothetical protein, secreted, partial [human gut metagenome]